MTTTATTHPEPRLRGSPRRHSVNAAYATATLGAAAPNLARAAAIAFGVSAQQVLGTERTQAVSWARQFAMAAARQHGYTLEAIADTFKRNHSTVIFAERAVAERVKADAGLREVLDHLTDHLTVALGSGPPAIDGLDALMPRLGGQERLLDRLAALEARAADAETLAVAERDRGQAAERDLAAARRELARMAGQVKEVDAMQRDLAKTRRALKSMTTRKDRLMQAVAAARAEQRAAAVRYRDSPGAHDLRRAYNRGYRAGRSSKSRPAPRGPRRRDDVLGVYATAAGQSRRVLLTVMDGERVLVDRAPGDTRVIERLGASTRLMSAVAIARDYLDEATSLGRPLVAQSRDHEPPPGRTTATTGAFS